MNIDQCVREHEVVTAVSSGRWNEELRSHVTACPICNDVQEVASALRTEYSALSGDVRVPSAGLVWWRSELRARREAMRVAERPMTLVHAFSGACALGVIAAVMNQISPLFQQSVLKLISYVPGNPALLLQHLPLALTLGVFIILAPVVLYLVLSEK